MVANVIHRSKPRVEVEKGDANAATMITSTFVAAAAVAAVRKYPAHMICHFHISCSCIVHVAVSPTLTLIVLLKLSLDLHESPN